MEDKIEKIFELLTKWYEYPKYQLERRLDIFFSIYLPEILKEKGIYFELKDIFPEFPLKKENNQSTNVDYAIFENKDDEANLYLVELKTEMNSISLKQADYYKKAQEKNLIDILGEIIEIKKHSKQWRKYEKLLKDIKERYNIIKPNSKEKEKKREWIVNDNNPKILNNVKVIYIVPNNEKDELLKEKNNFEVIYFDDIIKIIENKYNDRLSKMFCSILKKMRSSKNFKRNKSNSWSIYYS